MVLARSDEFPGATFVHRGEINDRETSRGTGTSEIPR